MKNFDFKRKSLEKIPLLNEIDDIELRLEDNSISLLDSVPETCKRLYLANNKYFYNFKYLEFLIFPAIMPNINLIYLICLSTESLL